MEAWQGIRGRVVTSPTSSGALIKLLRRFESSGRWRLPSGLAIFTACGCVPGCRVESPGIQQQVVGAGFLIPFKSGPAETAPPMPRLSQSRGPSLWKRLNSDC